MNSSAVLTSPTVAGRDRVYGALKPRQAPSAVELEVLLPAPSNGRRIGPTLVALIHYLITRRLRAAVTVIDDGSSDRTVDIVNSSARSSVCVGIVGSAQRGRKAAIRKAVLQSEARWIGFCDVDLSTPMETFDHVLAALRAGNDIVSTPGFRFFERETARQLFRRSVLDGFDLDVEVQNLISAAEKTTAEAP